MLPKFKLTPLKYCDYSVPNKKPVFILGHDHLLEIQLLDTRLRDTFLTKSTARHKK
jgi:hypothetical protein